jgi:hypothetical protein
VLVQEVPKAQRVETQFFMWVIQSSLLLAALVVVLGPAFRQVVHVAATLLAESAVALEELVVKVVLAPTTRGSQRVMVAPV